MADIKLARAAAVDFTLVLENLATSATFIAGQQSSARDATTDNFLDYLVGGKVVTGITPTAGSIRVYLWGAFDDSGTDADFPKPIVGATGPLNLVDVERLGVSVRLFEEMPTNTTPDEEYSFSPKGIASYFGGIIPTRWGVFVTHDTVANLQNTGANSAGILTSTGVYMTA